MPFYRRLSRRQSTGLPELLSEVETLFNDLVNQRDQRARGQEPFICYYELRSIWGDNRIQKLVSHIAPERKSDVVYQKLLRVVSILVFIGWDRWTTDFETIFLAKDKTEEQYDWLDAKLPFADFSFLPSRYRYHFSINQYIFLPIRIEQGKNQEVSSERRLPFVDSSDVVGRGGFGEVTRCKIAPGQFLDDAEPPRLNTEVR